MDGAIAAFKHDLASLRTGRASSNLLDPIQVPAYGTHDADQPGRHHHGAGAAHDLGLGLGQVDGRRRRPRHPRIQSRLQSDRRRHHICASRCRSSTSSAARNWSRSRTQYAEQARVAARHVRRDGMDHLKKAEKDGDDQRGRPAQSQSDQRPEDDRRDDHHDRQLACRQRSRDHAGLGACLSTLRDASPNSEFEDADARACRDHHGRQRPLGEGARPAAARRSSRGVEALRKTRPRGQRDRHRLADRLRLLVGELVAAEVRGQRPDGPAEAVHPPRPRRTSPERRQGAASSATAAGLQPTSRLLLDEAETLTARQPRTARWSSPSTMAARDEIARAARKIGRGGASRHARPRRDRPRRRFAAYLDTAGIPDPDLVIRTSGEMRAVEFPALAGRLQRARLPAVLLAGFHAATTSPRRSRPYAARERRFGGVAGPRRRLMSGDADGTAGAN